MPQAEPQVMQCMEVWGGNQVVNCGVVMAGLDAWAYSQPYDDADSGGDLYYVSSCATGRITRLLVADVSGHGQTVSSVAGGLRNLMRRFVNFVDQSVFVREMNEKFAAISESNSFATAVVTTFLATKSKLSVSNAGHPPPLIYRHRKKKWYWLEAEEIEKHDDGGPSNIPLGIIDGTDYEQFEIKLDVGDIVLCYTDSLTESHDANGNLLGQEGLMRLIQKVDPGEPSQIIEQLLDAVRNEATGNLTEDDVTILLFRANGLAPKVPFATKIAAPFRLLGTILRRPFPGSQPIPWPDMRLNR